MKKLFLSTAAFALLAGTSAYAEFNVNVDVGVPAPEYIAPAPVVVAPAVPMVVAEPHNRAWHADWWYWQERRDRQAWEYAHPHGHWDHDAWMREHNAYHR